MVIFCSRVELKRTTHLKKKKSRFTSTLHITLHFRILVLNHFWVNEWYIFALFFILHTVYAHSPKCYYFCITNTFKSQTPCQNCTDFYRGILIMWFFRVVKEWCTMVSSLLFLIIMNFFTSKLFWNNDLTLMTICCTVVRRKYIKWQMELVARFHKLKSLVCDAWDSMLN